ELAVRLQALVLVELEGPVVGRGGAGAPPQVVEVGRAAVRPLAVGAAGGLQLQDAQVYPHLEHGPAVAALDLARLDRPGFVIPPAQGGVDVFAHVCFLAAWRAVPVGPLSHFSWLAQAFTGGNAREAQTRQSGGFRDCFSLRNGT